MGIRSDLLAATRRTLCETAMQLFVERGLAATKVEDILRGSGVSVGSFYYLFKNKLDLAANLYVETQLNFYQSLLQEISQYQEAREGVEALVRAYLRWASEHPQETYYLLYRREVEIIEIADEQGKASERDFHQRLHEWLQPRIMNESIQPFPHEQCMALWLGPTMYLVRLILAPYGSYLAPSQHELQEQLLTVEKRMATAAWQALHTHHI
jgi:AcrR family transcriptional regulator